MLVCTIVLQRALLSPSYVHSSTLGHFSVTCWTPPTKLGKHESCVGTQLLIRIYIEQSIPYCRVMIYRFRIPKDVLKREQ